VLFRSGGVDAAKATKDRAQAEFLIAALAETRTDELREAYETALSRGANWQRRIEASLKRLPAAAERLEQIRL